MNKSVSGDAYSWVDVLPAHWAHIRLGSCFGERNTTTTAEQSLPLSVTKSGVVEQHDYVAKSREGAPKKLVRSGDLVINSRSDRKGSAGLAPRDGSVSLINIVLEPQGIHRKFAHHLLRSTAFQEEFFRHGSGIVDDLWTTRYSAMKLIRLPIPPKWEQRAIADFLDYEIAEIDAFIADIQKVEDLTKERMSAFIDSELSPVAEKMIPLRRLKPVQASGVSVNGVYWPAAVGEPGVLKTGAVSKGWFDPTENKAVVEPRELGRLTTAVYEDRVLVNRANTPDLVGSAVYVSTSCPGLYLSDKIWSLDFDANNAFVSMLLSTRHYREQVRQMAVGASSSMQNLSYADFLKIEAYVPDPKAQAELVKKISTQSSLEFELLDQLTMAHTLAHERRAALISAAVTGQIDVAETRRPAAEVLEDEVRM